MVSAVESIGGDTLERLPVFPLPNTVFFPGTELPLHVFEPRYRDLVERCIAEGHRSMGVPLLEPGHEAEYEGRPPIHRIFGAGVLTQVEQQADGRYNIVLQGTDRLMMVEELAPEESFRRVRAVRLADHPSGNPAGNAEHMLRTLALRLADAVSEVREPLTRLLGTTRGAARLADELACRLIPDASRRQVILEERDPTARAQMVIETMAEVCLRVDPSCQGHGPAN